MDEEVYLSKWILLKYYRTGFSILLDLISSELQVWAYSLCSLCRSLSLFSEKELSEFAPSFHSLKNPHVPVFMINNS